MGSTINPRARGGSSLSGELRASRDDRQQIRRLTSKPTKPAPAAVAGALSGGIAQGSGLRDLGGALDDTSATWFLADAPDWNAPPSWLTVDAGRLILGPGWYMLSLELDIGWAAGAAHDRVIVRLGNSFGDGNAWNYAKESSATTLNADGTRKGIQRVINWGHAILADSYPLVLSMEFYGGSAGAGSLGRQSSSSPAVATWYIARLG